VSSSHPIFPITSARHDTRPHLTPLYPPHSSLGLSSTSLFGLLSDYLRYLASSRFTIISRALGILPFTQLDEPKRHCDCILTDRADPCYIADSRTHDRLQLDRVHCPVQSLTAADLILYLPRGGEGRPLESLYLLPHNVVNSLAPLTHNVFWRVLAPVVRSAKKLEVIVDVGTSLILRLFPTHVFCMHILQSTTMHALTPSSFSPPPPAHQRSRTSPPCGSTSPPRCVSHSR
jgi:hypothetical protein